MTAWVGDPKPEQGRVREWADDDPEANILPGVIFYTDGPVGVINATSPHGENMLLLEVNAVRENERGGVNPTARREQHFYAFTPEGLALFAQTVIDGLALMEHRGMITRDADGKLR